MLAMVVSGCRNGESYARPRIGVKVPAVGPGEADMRGRSLPGVRPDGLLWRTYQQVDQRMQVCLGRAPGVRPGGVDIVGRLIDPHKHSRRQLDTLVVMLTPAVWAFRVVQDVDILVYLCIVIVHLH